MPPGGKPKGNVDADLVLHTMIELDNYTKAVLVTSDGDFSSLVAYLHGKEKLEVVLSPATQTCSRLLKKAARERIQFLQPLQARLEYPNKK